MYTAGQKLKTLLFIEGSRLSSKQQSDLKVCKKVMSSGINFVDYNIVSKNKNCILFFFTNNEYNVGLFNWSIME